MRLSARSLIWKWFYYCRTNKTHFHKKTFALSLVLKERVLGTRKRPTDEHNGLVHTYQDIFENRDLSLFSKKKFVSTRSVFESFPPLHSKTLADDGNTIASLTGHALYDVWRHRNPKPSFSSVHTITISTLFLKKLHSGNRFRKAAFLMHENAVEVWTQGLNGEKKTPFSKIPRYVWMGLVLKLKFGVVWMSVGEYRDCKSKRTICKKVQANRHAMRLRRENLRGLHTEWRSKAQINCKKCYLSV